MHSPKSGTFPAAPSLRTTRESEDFLTTAGWTFDGARYVSPDGTARFLTIEGAIAHALSEPTVERDQPAPCAKCPPDDYCDDCFWEKSEYGEHDTRCTCAGCLRFNRIKLARATPPWARETEPAPANDVGSDGEADEIVTEYDPDAQSDAMLAADSEYQDVCDRHVDAWVESFEAHLLCTDAANDDGAVSL